LVWITKTRKCWTIPGDPTALACPGEAVGKILAGREDGVPVTLTVKGRAVNYDEFTGERSVAPMGTRTTIIPSNVSAPQTAVAETPVTLTVKGSPVPYDLTSLYHYTNEPGMTGS
jgi:hypothetical protein